MHLCLILSKTDVDKIYNNQFNLLSFSIQGTLRAIALSEHVEYVSIAEIPIVRNNVFSKVYKIKNLLNKIIKKFNSIAFKISEIIDIIDVKINKYQIHGLDINPDEFLTFKSKIKYRFLFSQYLSGYFSFTSSNIDQQHVSPEIDFFVRGSGLRIEKGDILYKFSKLGVLSLHHGDSSFNRGGPVGFWETFYRESSGITAQILNKELDGGDVIYKSELRTIPNALANKRNIYKNTCPTLLISFNNIPSTRLSISI